MKLKALISAVTIGLLAITACDSAEEEATDQPDVDNMEIKVEDPHSYAKPEVAKVTHLDLSIRVNFEESIISGIATYDIEKADDADMIIFDTRDLTIEEVKLDDAETPVDFSLGEANEYMGQALRIPITRETQKVHIQYTTSPDAAALQWLSPAQTSGEDPFLFTQSQAILARTWIPIQDGPGIRFTYEANVQVPPGLLAVMSAENPMQANETGVYEFKMEQPIPSYLMALAVGDLAFAPIGERTGVYAEPSMLEAAVYEFGDMEKMLEKAEALYGPYRWGRYDVLVLPPSFPFGGMENPRLTFATPTILAGDRSLTTLIAHELAHSWSGNLVTNANWNDFWLNEGFTVYFEWRIMEALYGESYADMIRQLGYQDLENEITDLTEKGQGPDTELHLQLEGRDPDEGMTSIAYEKGALFLLHIEQTIGRERFDKFLSDYFDTYAFKVMNTEGFLTYLNAKLIQGDEELAQTINADGWVYSPGLPEDHPVVTTDRFTRVDDAVNSWLEGTAAAELETSEWSTHEWLHFIRQLPSTMNQQQMADLDAAFGFTSSGNSEIQAAWYEHAIRNQYEPAYEALEEFLTNVGRRKFLQPLYEALAETPDGKAMALAIYEQARPNYHAVSYNTIDGILDYQAN